MVLQRAIHAHTDCDVRNLLSRVLDVRFLIEEAEAMSTTAVRCPFCGVWMRVAVQPSHIEKVGRLDDSRALKVKFDDQVVAHICIPKKESE